MTDFVFSIGLGTKSTTADEYDTKNFADFAQAILSCDFLDGGVPSKPASKAEKEALPWFAAPFTGGKRNGQNALPWPVLVLDVDKCSLKAVKPVAAFLRGLAPCFGYTTVSHTEDAPRFRVCLKMSRAIDTSEGKRLAAGIAARFADEHPDLRDQVVFDPAQQSAGQIAFLPCKGFQPIPLKNVDQPPLDVDAWLVEECIVSHADADSRPETEAAVEELRSALAMLSANCDRGRWRDICFAIRSTRWSESRDIALEWSQTAPEKFDQGEFDKLWADGEERAGGAKRTLASLYLWAKEAGWKLERLPLGDDIQNARAFTKEHPGVAFSPVLNAFVIFEDGRWRACDACIHQSMQAFAEDRRNQAEKALAGELQDARLKASLAAAKRFCNRHGQIGALSALQTMVSIEHERGHKTLDRSAFDQNGRLLAVPGGMVVEITPEGWRSRPAVPNDWLMRQTGIAPSRAEPKELLKCLDRVFDGDQAKIEWFQQYLGTACLGESSPGMAILLGAGNDGKTMLTKVIERLLGDYAKNISADALCKSRHGQGDGPRAQLYSLIGARFAVVNEIGSAHLLDAELIKAITGGDKITVRTLYQEEPVSVAMKCTVHTVGNSLPSISGQHQQSLARRMNVVHFPRPLEKHEIDPALFDCLTAPSSGAAILCWALDGAVKYLKAGRGTLPDCADIQERTADFLGAGDDLARWKREHIRPATPAEEGTLAGVLFDSFRRYKMEADPQARVTQQAFGRALASAGIKQLPGKAAGRRYPLMLLGDGNASDFA